MSTEHHECPDLLREQFEYNMSTGRIRHAKSKWFRGSKVATYNKYADTRRGGTSERKVRVYACRESKLVPAHHVAWLIVHGSIPKGTHVLHLNGDKSDNRLANLALGNLRRGVQAS